MKVCLLCRGLQIGGSILLYSDSSVFSFLFLCPTSLCFFPLAHTHTLSLSPFACSHCILGLQINLSLHHLTRSSFLFIRTWVWPECVCGHLLPLSLSSFAFLFIPSISLIVHLFSLLSVSGVVALALVRIVPCVSAPESWMMLRY